MSILGRNNDIDEISLHLFSLLTSPPICAKLHIQNGTNLILIFCINLIQNVLSSILPKLDCCNNLINGDMIYDDTYIYSDPKQASNHWDLESSPRSDELSVLIPTSRHLFISSSSHTDSWEGNLPKDSIDTYGYVWFLHTKPSPVTFTPDLTWSNEGIIPLNSRYSFML